MKKRKEQKCMCGEQTTFGNANVEIGGICHRVNNPCYVIDPQPKESWEEDFYKVYNAEKGNIVKDLVLIDFIKNLLEEQKRNIIDDVLRKIDTDKNGRDITIYELGGFLIDKFIKRIKGL